MALSLTVPEAATLTFDANGGTGTMDAVSGRVGVGVQLPACTFTAPDGKDFLCWNTQADAGDTRYYAGSTFMPAASQTLYAEWGEGYVIDLTATAVNASVAIPLGLSAQLTQLTGYFNNETDPMGLDVNLDGVKDLAIVQAYDDVNNVMTASVTKLNSLTANYRFVLTAPTEEGKYGCVLIKFVSDGSVVEPGDIELLYDDNGTYNSGQLLVLKDGQTHNLMLSDRTLYTDGDWNTLCLPFGVDDFTGTPLEGATVKTLESTSFTDGTLTMTFSDDQTAIEAGVPYIVKWTSGTDIVNPVFTGVTISNTAANVSTQYVDFVGTYSPTIIYESGDKHNLYLGSGNTLYYPTTEGFTVNACRAYFQLKNGLTAGDPSSSEAPVRAFVLDFGDGEETAIRSLTPDASPTGKGSDGWYTLDGRRLSAKPSASGIYINNGRKVVIK